MRFDDRNEVVKRSFFGDTFGYWMCGSPTAGEDSSPWEVRPTNIWLFGPPVIRTNTSLGQTRSCYRSGLRSSSERRRHEIKIHRLCFFIFPPFLD